ncbi:MAG: hypothetical protein K5771_08345, partial [Oscillospiraceae bacterium]|nr:hypothetical protein [Oscillospiraceae bacterium]
MAYKFRGVTDRVWAFREMVRDRVIAVDAERVMSVVNAYKKYDKLPPDIKIPKTTYEIVSNMTVRVEDFDVFVGNIGKEFLGCGVWPEWEAEWLFSQLAGEDPTHWTLWDDGYYHCDDTTGVRLIMKKEEAELFMSTREFWKTHTFSSGISSWLPDGFDECAATGVNLKPGQLFGGLCTGHL